MGQTIREKLEPLGTRNVEEGVSKENNDWRLVGDYALRSPLGACRMAVSSKKNSGIAIDANPHSGALVLNSPYSRDP